MSGCIGSSDVNAGSSLISGLSPFQAHFPHCMNDEGLVCLSTGGSSDLKTLWRPEACQMFVYSFTYFGKTPSQLRCAVQWRSRAETYQERLAEFTEYVMHPWTITRTCLARTPYFYGKGLHIYAQQSDWRAIWRKWKEHPLLFMVYGSLIISRDRAMASDASRRSPAGHPFRWI